MLILGKRNNACIFQATNWKDCISEDLDLAKKNKNKNNKKEKPEKKPQERNFWTNYIKAKTDNMQ